MQQPPEYRSREEIRNIHKAGLRFSGEDGEGNNYSSRDGIVWAYYPVTVEATLAGTTSNDKWFLIVTIQEQPFGAPEHWSLFASPEGQTGLVYQVNGDVTNMLYQTRQANVPISRSFLSSFSICDMTKEQAYELQDEFRKVPEPKSVRDSPFAPNCQDWVCWALKHLEDHRIIPLGSTEKAISKLQRELRRQGPTKIEELAASYAVLILFDGGVCICPLLGESNRLSRNQ